MSVQYAHAKLRLAAHSTECSKVHTRSFIRCVGAKALLRLLNLYTRIAPRFDLASIFVIKDFIRMDHSATFIGMNRREADLHTSGSICTSTATMHTQCRDLDSVLHLCRGCSHKKCLPRHRQGGEAAHEKQGAPSHTFLHFNNCYASSSATYALVWRPYRYMRATRHFN
jgi:hypothetical protein